MSLAFHAPCVASWHQDYPPGLATYAPRTATLAEARAWCVPGNLPAWAADVQRRFSERLPGYGDKRVVLVARKGDEEATLRLLMLCQGATGPWVCPVRVYSGGAVQTWYVLLVSAENAFAWGIP